MDDKKILIVEDDDDLREALEETICRSGFKVSSVNNGKEALLMLTKEPYSMVITDIQMNELDGYSLFKSIKQKYQDIPVILMTAYATINQAISAIREGACEYLVKPFDANLLIKKIEENVTAQVISHELFQVVDPISKKVFTLAKRVSSSDVTVLINGESGTGKEVLARYIYQNSMRAKKRFVAINCAAIPENMLEAELFGYEKGSFTGAIQSYQGKFEQAQGGTLLLDEISEMDLNLQAKLLRVLQERELHRLGGRETIKLDVRLLATTNQDLRQAVKQNKFREDLFYRLNVFPLTIQPLRYRKEDILPLVNYMLIKHKKYLRSNSSSPLRLTNQAKEKLISHPWPGNVRELENVIQRALVICNGLEITAADLCMESINAEDSLNLEIQDGPHTLITDLKKHEQEKILKTLNDVHGSRKFAAEKLGISPRTLRYKLSKMREQGIIIPGSYQSIGT